MKRLFFILAAAVVVCSCAPKKYTYYQVYQARPVNSENITSTQDDMSYEDENCVIKYLFWAENGNAGFNIYNKTDKVLYIDMNKSFFVRNKHAFNYVVEQEVPEDAQPAFRPVVAIPPHAYRNMQPMQIWNKLYVDCDLIRFPKVSSSLSFLQQNTPMNFSIYLTYNLGEGTADVVVDNAFYISNVTNYAEPSFLGYRSRDKNPCLNKTNEEERDYKRKYPRTVYDKAVKINTSGRFFVVYEKYSYQELFESNDRYMLYDNDYNGYINIR